MITPKPLVDILLPLASTVLYECPAGKIATIKSAFLANRHTLSVSVNLYRKISGGTLTTQLITPDLPLLQNETVEVDRVIEFSAGDQLLGSATVVDVVSCEVDGFEVDAV